MDTFEYLTVLISVVVGLAVVHVLQGLARIITSPGRHKLSWVHSLWVMFSLLSVFNFWWFQLGYRPVVQWSSPLFVFILAYATALYLQCAIIVPEQPVDDYGSYFMAKRVWFFGILIVVLYIDTADTLLKPEGIVPFPTPGPLGITIQLASILSILGFAMYTRNRWYHGVLALLLFLNQCLQLFLRPEPGGG